MKKINFAIIEDEPSWRHLIQRELSKYPEFEIALTCSWGNTFFEEYKKVKLDYILLDLSLPGETGIVIANRLMMESPQLPIIVFTSSNNHSDITYFHSMGIKAFIHKSNICCLGGILKQITGASKNSGHLKPLDINDIKLLMLVCRKLTNYQIAEELNKSEKTVEKKLQSLCERLGLVNNRLYLFEYAIKNGYWNVHYSETGKLNNLQQQHKF